MKLLQISRLSFTIMVVAFYVFSGCAGYGKPQVSTPQVLVQKPDWPHEQSDLEVDPQVSFHRLPNGMRYILKQNQTPRDRVSMHLYLQVGSMAESEGQEGMAHFLEHMLFDGSEHFPPGEMVKYFQRIGMQFGPDANAHTGFGQTVYDILLPKGDTETFSEGLLVLKDYAQGALLIPQEVNKEKMVVLAEKRSRDSAQFRTFEASIGFQLPGTLFTRRFPIGRQESIEQFSADKLHAFYDAWYRPDRMILVVVGQFDTQNARRLIEEQFNALQPRAEAKSAPDFGEFQHRGVKAFYHHERESGSTSVRIETAEQRIEPADTVEYQRGQLLKDLANQIVQKRLDAVVQAQNGLLTNASISSGYYIQQIRYSEISAESKPEHWQAALAIVEQELRKALVHGFAPSELERAKSALRADLQRAVNEENTRQSKDLAATVIHSLNDWRVVQSPQQRMALLGPMLDTITAEQVHQTLADTWSAPHRLVLVTGNAEVNTNDAAATEKIHSAYQQSQQVDVSAPVNLTTARFPYLPEPTLPGAVTSRTRWEDLGIEQVLFSNGLRLLLKKTAFKENEVLASLSFGNGKSSEPADQPGLALLTKEAAHESGFGAMDRVALENALAGRLATVSIDLREDMFAINGQAATSELPLLFQLLYTCLQDPGYRPEALEIALKRLEQHRLALSHKVEGLMQLEGFKFLAGNDSRFGWPTWDRMQLLSIEHIQQWFGSQLASAPLELSVVGDFDIQAVIALSARYLGSLPARTQAVQSAPRSAPVFPAGSVLRLATDTDIAKALVTVTYPTEDYWDIQRTRRLNILAELFSERLRVDIREKLGAAYSPYAYHRPHRAYTGYGLFQSVVLVDPQQADAVVAEVKQIAQQMARLGVSQDELRRALDPTLAQIKDLRQSNTYWLSSVLSGASRHPEQLVWAQSIENDYAAITVEEMNALAKRYLDNLNVATIVITPQSQDGKQK